jgi:hypothetical protein
MDFAKDKKRSNDLDILSKRGSSKKCPALNDTFYESAAPVEEKKNDIATILEHVTHTCVKNVEQGHGEF